jgi:dTMP kinase
VELGVSAGRGIFVAVDGPKHAGKSELLRLVEPMLHSARLSVLVTKEPTPQFDLSNEERFSGLALAQLIAADRCLHVRETIEPGVCTHDVVITDRYIASSLVFQVLDGVSFDKVWALNADLLRPDLNIFLTVDESSVARRQGERGTATRFDRAARVGEEIALYEAVEQFLAGLGVSVTRLANTDEEPMQHTAKLLFLLIVQQLEARHG